MLMRRTITGVDLFCGGGGTSSGLVSAAQELGTQLDLLGINHWDVALETYSRNFPHLRDPERENVYRLSPHKYFPQGNLDLMVASPECIYHSIARGDGPCNDQSRSGAQTVLEWLKAIHVDKLLLENVKEFVNWGPLDKNGRPIKKLRGVQFQAFLKALTRLGYSFKWRILNCADYGDATTRERFFLMAKKGKDRTIRWPEPTHAEYQDDLFTTTKPWKPVSSIIDWSTPGKSIFARKVPLVDKTLARIEHGLREHGGKDFLIKYFGTGKSESLSRPITTILANGNHHALIQPFITIYKGQSKTRSIGRPLPALTTQKNMYLSAPVVSTSLTEPLMQRLGSPSLEDPFALVKFFRDTPGLDIMHRMLTPGELASAHSFPADYKWAGTGTDIVKQVGNSVPRKTAKALCKTLLKG